MEQDSGCLTFEFCGRGTVPILSNVGACLCIYVLRLHFQSPAAFIKMLD